MIGRRIVIVGPGAVGSSLAAWLAEAGLPVELHGRPPALDRLEALGLRHYRGSSGPDSARLTRPLLRRSLAGLGSEDLLVFCTKNGSLDAAAEEAARVLGQGGGEGPPFALSLANGLDNQAILPRHFPRCAFGIVGYNCWLDEPGLVGWQSRGPLLLGRPDGDFAAEIGDIIALLGRALPVEGSRRFQDAVHAKLVVNLANTVTTLVGQGFRPIDDLPAFQRLLGSTLAEGVRVVEAAGYRAHPLGPMPSYALIKAMASLPAWLTRIPFRRNLAKMVRSSMSQDVIQRGRRETELESLTGYIVELARRQGLAAPWNEGLYRVARERFAEPVFRPLGSAELLALVAPKA